MRLDGGAGAQHRRAGGRRDQRRQIHFRCVSWICSCLPLRRSRSEDCKRERRRDGVSPGLRRRGVACDNRRPCRTRATFPHSSPGSPSRSPSSSAPSPTGSTSARWARSPTSCTSATGAGCGCGCWPSPSRSPARPRWKRAGLVDLSKTIYTTPRIAWLSYLVGGLPVRLRHDPCFGLWQQDADPARRRKPQVAGGIDRAGDIRLHDAEGPVRGLARQRAGRRALGHRAVGCRALRPGQRRGETRRRRRRDQAGSVALAVAAAIAAFVFASRDFRSSPRARASAASSSAR